MDPTNMRIPDGIEPIVGYRCWRYTVGHAGTSLFPLNFLMDASGRSQWEGAESRWVGARCLFPHNLSLLRLVGTCVCGGAADPGRPPGGCPLCGSRPHEAPNEGCKCGFYAMRSITSELIGAVAGGHRWEEGGTVLGLVLLAGKVIEHDLGYRAERARIGELIPVRGRERWVKQLADRLGLPVGLAVEYI
jgi:hypothetical protein